MITDKVHKRKKFLKSLKKISKDLKLAWDHVTKFIYRVKSRVMVMN